MRSVHSKSVVFFPAIVSPGQVRGGEHCSRGGCFVCDKSCAENLPRLLEAYRGFSSYQLTSLPTCISSVLINSIQDCADCKLYTNVESLVQYTALTSSAFSKPVVATVTKGEAVRGTKQERVLFFAQQTLHTNRQPFFVSQNTKPNFRPASAAEASGKFCRETSGLCRLAWGSDAVSTCWWGAA